jgi:hypothetical protein
MPVSGVVERGACKYLDVRLEHPHFANAPQDSERAAPEKSAQGSGVREGVAQGGFAYLRNLELESTRMLNKYTNEEHLAEDQRTETTSPPC